ncbi:MAG: hypothetical protein GF353_03765 [Candidatus Lokiarchaeota archaeon]|nr:hypothetical protein [Candidatus Lokiarchaeota archaeon]
MEKNWKQLLLKSGLPLEYEVRESFVENGCIVWDETTYIRNDEDSIEKEFSYDVHANTSKGGYSIDFLIECKFKVENTKWFFLPDPYNYQYDVDRLDFFHPIDHFSKGSFIMNHIPYSHLFEPIGPFCQKGIEIFGNTFLEKNIRKAINQLSYVFIERIIECWDNQLNNELFKNSIFLNIPIIITNADLFQINPKTTISMIKQADSIENISQKCNFILYHNRIGEQLRRYNIEKFNKYFQQIEQKVVEKNFNTFTKDFIHFANILCSNYSPRLIIIMQHTDDHKNYVELFNYISSILEPDDVTKNKIDNAMEIFSKKIDAKMDESRKKIRKNLNKK